jgi:LemA protein
VSPVLIGIIVVIVLIAIGLIVSYNRFVSQRQLIKDSYANIDTELRRRYDLIPNLVETVKGYAAHERGTFEAVTQARANAISAQGPAQQAQSENILSGALKSLFAVAEAYPDLKANQNFLALQGELSNTEDRIQTSRRFYNSNVRDFNRRVQAFPSSVIAGMFHFQAAEYFEVDQAIRDAGAPQVSFDSATGGGAAPGGPAAPAAPASPAASPPSSPPAAGAPASDPPAVPPSSPPPPN